MLAMKVPKKDAQKAKEYLLSKGILSDTHNAKKKGNFVYFPLKKKIKSKYDIVQKQFSQKKKKNSFKEIVGKQLSAKELKILKTAQDTIGDIAIIEIPEELRKKGKLLGKALLKAKPYIKTALMKGKHDTKYRTQKLKWLAGKKTKETIHKENNVKLKVDVEKVYFSPRLSSERERISKLIKKNEKVLVMFSGCGPFLCVMSKNSKAKELVGIEINPIGHKYALENIKLNKLSNVRAYKGDVAKIVPKLKEKFYRILMPAPHDAKEYISIAFKALKKEGYLHFYTFAKEKDTKKIKEFLRIEAAKHGFKIRILKEVKCGQVSPGEYRICFDILAENFGF